MKITGVKSFAHAAPCADMRGDDGLISVDCKFCSRIFAIPA